VRAEDQLAVWRAPIDETDEPLELPVLYQDEHLLVIDKPPLIAVHPTARHHNMTVIKLLEARRPGEFFSLVHRLDRETSGVLLLARSRQADRSFKRLIEDRSLAELAGGGTAAHASAIHKTYLAITWGTPQAGLVDRPLELDPDNSLRVKMRLAPRGGLEARTEVEIVESTEGYCLVSCRLLTGRQHQIRVHLAALGCPVVGDKLYGPDDRMLARSADRELSDEDRERLELDRHALHAHRYEMRHAVTGAALALSSPLPADLAAFWKSKGGTLLPGVPADPIARQQL
jgi:23S rRNA pseudouridine1911/1915/1917 synthase